MHIPRPRPATLSLLAPWLLVLGLLACSDPTGSGDAPADHTLVLDGVAHAPGASSAPTTCVQCHGSDLRGGDDGEPSCYSCHGVVWDDGGTSQP